MAEWDTETERRWRSWLGAAGSINATADHDPLEITSAWRVLDIAAHALRQHLERTGATIDEALADPETRTRLQAMATTMWGRVQPGEVDWAIGTLAP